MELQKAQMMMRDLVTYYCGEEVQTTFNKRLKRALGRARYKRVFDSANRCWAYSPGIIELNYEFAQDNHEVHVLETILHEIAHILTKGHGHNRIWRAKAFELGCAVGSRFHPKEITINGTTHVFNSN